ncbi:MAG TPA: hypothetical protein VH913_07470 [Hyphomicrobiaceae bacterium]|jgi:hypothetical protein
MGSRSLFASLLLACLLAVGFFGIAPVASAESGGQSLKSGKIAGNNVIATKRRFRRHFRSVKIHLPIGPSYVYYDYPYYYSRGYYPTHIGGYVYYPYYYYRTYYWGYNRGPASRRGQRALSK